MNKNRELVSNTLILSIGQFVPSILNIILLPILTENLSTKEYGIYDVVIMFITLLVPICTIQLQQATFRYLIISNSEDDKVELITNTIVFESLLIVLLYPIIFVLLKLYFKEWNLCISICILLFGQSLYRIEGQIARGVGKNTVYSIGIIIYSLINISIIIGLLLFRKITYITIIYSQGIAYVLSGIIIFFLTNTWKYLKIKKINGKKIKELVQYSIPIVPSSISLWIVNLSDRLIITLFLDVAANGIYSVANKIPNMYASVYSVFNLAWTETAVKTYNEGNAEEYFNQLFDSLFKIMIGSLSILIAFNYIVFKLFVRGDFNDAFLQVPILYVGVFVNSLVSFYGAIYISIAKTKNIGISSVIGALLNIVINVVLIKKIGLYAASISTVVSYLVILYFRIQDLKQYIKLVYNKRTIIVGLMVLILIITISYFNNLITCIISIILAFIYNLKENMYVIKFIINYMKRRIENK